MKKLKFTVARDNSGLARLGQLVGDTEMLNAEYCYIHGKAETLAGYDIPDYISGDIMQLRKPVEEQDIEMILPDDNVLKINAHYSCCSDHFLLILPSDEASLYDYMHSDPYTCKSDYCRARYRLIEKPERERKHAEWLTKMQARLI